MASKKTGKKVAADTTSTPVQPQFQVGSCTFTLQQLIEAGGSVGLSVDLAQFRNADGAALTLQQVQRLQALAEVLIELKGFGTVTAILASNSP